MNVRIFPRHNLGGTLGSTMAAALGGLSFAPSRLAPPAATLELPKPTLLERLDRWAWRQVQKEREAYLAQAQNLADLENRMRDLDSCRGRFF